MCCPTSVHDSWERSTQERKPSSGDIAQLHEKVPTHPADMTTSDAASVPALGFLGASKHWLPWRSLGMDHRQIGYVQGQWGILKKQKQKQKCLKLFTEKGPLLSVKSDRLWCLAQKPCYVSTDSWAICTLWDPWMEVSSSVGTNTVAAHCTGHRPRLCSMGMPKRKAFKAKHRWDLQADQTCTAREEALLKDWRDPLKWESDQDNWQWKLSCPWSSSFIKTLRVLTEAVPWNGMWWGTEEPPRLVLRFSNHISNPSSSTSHACFWETGCLEFQGSKRTWRWLVNLMLLLLSVCACWI